jgi:hypothetical protein
MMAMAGLGLLYAGHLLRRLLSPSQDDQADLAWLFTQRARVVRYLAIGLLLLVVLLLATAIFLVDLAGIRYLVPRGWRISFPG